MARSGHESVAVVEELLDAFSAADLDRMGATLAPDLLAYITNSEGGEDEVRGRDAYLKRVEAMDPAAVRFSVEPTQAPVLVDDDLVLVMVEIHAEKDDRRLHNFAAHLLRLADGLVSEWRMVEAKPAESDRFWS